MPNQPLGVWGVRASRLSIRFGAFVLDLDTGELKRSGVNVRLAPQPSKVLVLLVKRTGQLVTREEIRGHIWANDIFVDFDKGLNFCIKQIRAALRDDADRPRYIETIPRRGYRFIAPIEKIESEDSDILELHKGQSTDLVEHVRNEATAWLQRARTSVLLAVAASLLLLVSGSSRRVRTVHFSNPGWMIIGAFENKTGESIFDGTVESALQRELSESQFVSIVPAERVEDALWLMKKNKHARLEPEVAREVALRDGNTALILTGRVEKLGHTYVVSASLTEPASGLLIRSLSEEAGSEDAILTSVHRLAKRVSDSVGETDTLSLRNRGVLEKATTPSLHALQFYSKGIAFINEDDWATGTEMLNRAVEEDPNFASAHVYLAHCYAEAGKAKEAQLHFDRAFQLATNTTDRERYFILGSYYSFKGDSAQAIDAYQVLVQLYPDDFWGINNLAVELRRAGRMEDAEPYLVRRAELRPNALDLNAAAWWALSSSGHDPARAQDLLDRIKALLNESGSSERFPDLWTQLQFLTADQYLRQGDAPQALQELDRVAAKLQSASGDAHALFLDELGSRYFALGRLHDAERYFRQMPEESQHLDLSGLAEARGDHKTFRRELLAQFASGKGLGPGTAARLAREGFLSQAEKILNAPLMARARPSSRVQAARGELIFARGHRREGLQEIRAAWHSLRSARNDESLMVSEHLSDALVKTGNTAEAVEVLEQELADKHDLLALYDISGCERRLVTLYRNLGREEDARAMEFKIREQFSVADADHPMLTALKTSSTTAAVP